MEFAQFSAVYLKKDISNGCHLIESVHVSKMSQSIINEGKLKILRILSMRQ